MKRSIIVLIRKLSLILAAIFMVTTAFAQQNGSGTVVDDTGVPLPGVSSVGYLNNKGIFKDNDYSRYK